ncbi:unnamed protein product [Trichobilharzia regenti]|nr:unnamed protein product [Trichobilharzia regenti]
MVLRKPASESSNLSKFDNNSVEMDPTVESTNFVELTNTAAITTTMTTTTATTPTGTSTPITAMAIASPTSPPTTTTTTTTEMSSSSSSFIGSMTNSFSFPTVSSSSSFNMGKDSIYHRQKMFNNSEGINNNTNNNVNINNNKSHHSVSTDWNWWPLNLLTCMFSSTPPQRFTMLIAYAM